MERWKWSCQKFSTRLRVASPLLGISFCLRTGTPRPCPTSCQSIEEVPNSSRTCSLKCTVEEIRKLGALTLSAQVMRAAAVAILIPCTSLYIYFFLPLSHHGCDNDFATGIFGLTCTTRLVRSCHTTPSGLVKFHLFSTGWLVTALVLLLSPFKFALSWHWCCSTVFSDSLVLVHHLPRSTPFWLQYHLLPHSVLLFLLVRWCGAFNLIFWPLFPLQKVHTSEKKSVIQEEGWAYYTFSSYPLFGLNRDDKFR